MTKRLIALIACAVFCAAANSASALKIFSEAENVIIMTIGDPYMTVNGESAEIDPGNGTVPVVSAENRTLVPIRAIVEAMGGEVEWYEPDNEIRLYSSDSFVRMRLNIASAVVNNEPKEIDTAPVITNNRTMVPVRFVAESLGCEVFWDQDAQQVKISRLGSFEIKDEIDENDPNNKVCINVGQETVTVGELKYIVSAMKEEEMVEDVTDAAVEYVIGLAATADLARANNVEINKFKINAAFNSIPAADLEAIKERYGISSDTMKAFIRKNMLSQEYSATALMTDPRMTPTDEALKKIFAEKYIKVQHILVLTTNDVGAPLTDEEKAVKKKEIEELLKKARTPGADFTALMLEKSEDPGSKNQPDGYVFTDGQMVTEFYGAAISIKENEISDVIETNYGYHIVKRLPLDMEKDYEANAADSLTNVFLRLTAQEIVNDFKSTIEITKNEELIKSVKTL